MYESIIKVKIRPFKPGTVPENAAPAALVNAYAPMLRSCPVEQAEMWLSGLESILDRARQHDAELERNLRRILNRPRGKLPKVQRVNWIETGKLSPERPHQVSMFRRDTGSVSTLKRGQKAAIAIGE
jgi:hypothetical protein